MPEPVSIDQRLGERRRFGLIGAIRTDRRSGQATRSGGDRRRAEHRDASVTAGSDLRHLRDRRHIERRHDEERRSWSDRRTA